MIGSEDQDPAALADQALLWQQAQRAMGPPSDQEEAVLLLRYFRGATTKEVATIMGITECDGCIGAPSSVCAAVRGVLASLDNGMQPGFGAERGELLKMFVRRALRLDAAGTNSRVALAAENCR